MNFGVPRFDDGIRRLGVAVARLTDAPWIHDVNAIDVAIAGDVRVAVHDSVSVDVADEFFGVRRENVSFRRRRMAVNDDVTFQTRLVGEVLEPPEVVVVELRPGVAMTGGHDRVGIVIRGSETSIVVPPNDHITLFADPPNTVRWITAITDDIARADEAINRREIIEDGVQRLPVGVDVGNDADAHTATKEFVRQMRSLPKLVSKTKHRKQSVGVWLLEPTFTTHQCENTPMIDAKAVADIVEESLGDPAEVEEIHDGVNTTFAFTIEDAEYIIKFGTFDVPSVRAEPHIVRTLDEHGLPVPTVRASGHHRGTPYFVMDKLAGEPLPYPQELSADRLIEVTPAVGEFLGQMQGIGCGVGRVRVRNGDISTSDENWETFYRGTLERFASQAKGNYPDLGSKAMELVHWTSIPNLDDAVFCPIDLHTGNVFLDDDGGLLGAIDFERVYGGHPGLAYAVTLHTLRCNRSEEVRSEVDQRFETGYTRSRSNTPGRHPAFDLLAVVREMRAAHMWWEDPGEHRNRLQTRLEEIEQKIEEES